jgi:hypothetical protein
VPAVNINFVTFYSLLVPWSIVKNNKIVGFFASQARLSAYITLTLKPICSDKIDFAVFNAFTHTPNEDITAIKRRCLSWRKNLSADLRKLGLD